MSKPRTDAERRELRRLYHRTLGLRQCWGGPMDGMAYAVEEPSYAVIQYGTWPPLLDPNPPAHVERERAIGWYVYVKSTDRFEYLPRRDFSEVRAA